MIILIKLTYLYDLDLDTNITNMAKTYGGKQRDSGFFKDENGIQERDIQFYFDNHNLFLDFIRKVFYDVSDSARLRLEVDINA